MNGELLEYLEKHLRSFYRSGSLKVYVRHFPTVGVRFKIQGGPWRETLAEAIAALRYADEFSKRKDL